MQAAQGQSKPHIIRRSTQPVRVGKLTIGGHSDVSVQSMCATKTQDTRATLEQIRLLAANGADIVRIAVDSKRDVDALKEIRRELDKSGIDLPLSVDLQESYRLVELIAPYVHKIRYNPGHLHHHEKNLSVFEKVQFIVEHARQHGCAIRIGINFGSLDPAKRDSSNDAREIALQSVDQHIAIMYQLEFDNFLVSLKSSDPNDVIDINRAFVERHPKVALHLGVTEAGMLPMGEVKTRIAFENLLAQGIGETLRASLTLPFAEKFKEVLVAKQILKDVYSGKFRSVPRFIQQGLNIISCPSCSRVENSAFVELAEKVREISAFAQSKNITIAVMGCRVNGPGESDDADLGLWCAPRHVNLKRRGELLGSYSYSEILPKLKLELQAMVSE